MVITKKDNFSICHICGKYAPMTREHVPPKSAFNKSTQKLLTGRNLQRLVASQYYPWEYPHVKIKDVKKVHMQGGIHYYSLCVDCNNHKTGHWYAPSYSDFIIKSYIYTQSIIKSNEMEANKYYEYSIKSVYPLRIIKQIFAMFCSINPIQLSQYDNNLIREFILYRDSKFF